MSESTEEKPVITDEDVEEFLDEHGVAFDTKTKILSTGIDVSDTDPERLKVLHIPVPLASGEFLLLSFRGGYHNPDAGPDDPDYRPQWESLLGPMSFDALKEEAARK